MIQYMSATLVKRQFVLPMYGMRLKYMCTGPHDSSGKSSTRDSLREKMDTDKKTLQWRKHSGQRTGDWYSKLKVFDNEEQTSDYIIMMQQPMDLTPSALKEWWRKRNLHMKRKMQSYIPERHEILGPDLAAAHFLLFRGGAVKFVHEQNFMRANEKKEFNLPTKYHGAYKIEALKCDGMSLYYEGLENLRNLEELKFLSFHNVITFDDWCLDRVSGSGYPKLEVLDISGTSCTLNGFSCLYRIPTLKLLIVNDPKETLEYELACSMLLEVIPKLKIVDSASIHNL
ncbi:distal membrane-arm assembly complex protein 2 [Eurosta solidaginis]|uniref:distal membrane-arm assembly complex protein 2 n=1 Tax=Eurosta solidaginis TaxID=178769 RepID=UPI00353107D5